jgi:small subunit ribosomal protein S8
MDLLCDMLTRIRNGQQNFVFGDNKIVKVKYNKICVRILTILKEEGLIFNYFIVGSSHKPQLCVVLSSKEGSGLQNRHQLSLSIVSKSSRRRYITAKELKEIFRVKQGFGGAIISTNRGLITDRQARQFNLGGELLCLYS